MIVARRAFVELPAKLLSTDFGRICASFSICRRTVFDISQAGIVGLAELSS